MVFFGIDFQKQTANSLGFKGAKILFEALDVNTTLTDLCLSGEGKKAKYFWAVHQDYDVQRMKLMAEGWKSYVRF